MSSPPVPPAPEAALPAEGSGARGGKLRQEKRDRIIDAAVDVFADKGFRAARISDIARAAGVADGTIYLYFDNKEHLLLSIFEEKMEFLRVGLLAASIRHPLHVAQAAQAGAHVSTIPHNVLKRLFLHPLTEKGDAAFMADWKAAGDVDVAAAVTAWLKKRG